MNNGIQFNIREKGTSEWFDIEVMFPNMKYMKCEGLEDVGEVKNAYTEEYADADTTRVYLPQQVKRKPTTITFTFAFFGNSKQVLYDNFINYVSGKVIEYYDTKRYRYAEMIFTNEVKPLQDNYIGKSYSVASFTFKNLKGFCEYIPPTPI